MILPVETGKGFLKAVLSGLREEEKHVEKYSQEPLIELRGPSHATSQWGHALRSALLGHLVLVQISDSALTHTWVIQPTLHLHYMTLPAPRLQACTACSCTKGHEIKPRTIENNAISKRFGKHKNV